MKSPISITYYVYATRLDAYKQITNGLSTEIGHCKSYNSAIKKAMSVNLDEQKGVSIFAEIWKRNLDGKESLLCKTMVLEIIK